MLFSDQFGISPGKDDDWFDPILDADTRLWVDPFFIFMEKDERWSSGHDGLVGHFDRVFRLLAKSGFDKRSPFYKLAVALLTFREPSEFASATRAAASKGREEERVSHARLPRRWSRQFGAGSLTWTTSNCWGCSTRGSGLTASVT